MRTAAFTRPFRRTVPFAAAGLAAALLSGPATAAAPAYHAALAEVGPAAAALARTAVVVTPAAANNTVPDGAAARTAGAAPVVQAGRSVCAVVPQDLTPLTQGAGLTVEQAARFSLVRGATFCGELSRLGRTAEALSRPENARTLFDVMVLADGTAAVHLAQTLGPDVVRRIAAQRARGTVAALASAGAGAADLLVPQYTVPLAVRAADGLTGLSAFERMVFRGYTVEQVRDKVADLYRHPEGRPSDAEFQALTAAFRGIAATPAGRPARIAALPDTRMFAPLKGAAARP